MNRALTWMMLVVSAFVALSPSLIKAGESTFDRKEDVIYGRKYGTALTMDVFTPTKDARGIGVIFVVSGGFFSSHEAINSAFVQPLIDRGFTVFAVVHGSQPRYTVPEIIQDMNRAVRFIRHHAKNYGIDPDRIGIYGGSAGGHLALMLGPRATRVTRMPRTRSIENRAGCKRWPAFSRRLISSTSVSQARR
ncbi:MAG: alpha/beta hydrolase [Isosphaeraceae bacterium]